MRSDAKVDCGMRGDIANRRALGIKVHRSRCAPTTSSSEGAKGSYGANRLTGTGRELRFVTCRCRLEAVISRSK